MSKELTKKYFGVDLIDKNLLAVHLIIRNDNPAVSYIVQPERITITKQGYNNVSDKPGSKSQSTGELVNVPVLEAVVRGVLFGPPAALGALHQYVSDASIVEENFEAKRLRTKTVDPGQQTAGFIYFNWEQVKALMAPELCIELTNLGTQTAQPHCVSVNLSRASQQ